MTKINNFDSFRIDKMKEPNDGTRSLLESIAFPEVEFALEDWKTFNDSNCVLIGGVAFSYYSKPRTTQDIDVLFLSDNDIPTDIIKFKRIRGHAFQHNPTHVEVEVVTPEHIGISKELAEDIFNTSIESNGIRMASVSGLVASKLGRFSLRDQADIEALMDDHQVDITPFRLDEKETYNFQRMLDYMNKKGEI